MKRAGIGIMMGVLCGLCAGAQPRSKPAKQKAKTAAAAPRTERGSMEQSSSSAAFGPVATGRFTIADPFVTLYNGRASGAVPLTEPVRPIPNVPKLRYGVANGHLLFYNTTAPTSGGSTGSGAVGTGTSLGNMGTNGAATGVNGKNPFAGPGIYGNRVRYSGQPVNLPPQRTKDANQRP
ncbi:MAG: hypothetical protein EOP50_07905 [Sphingobacteriales bacterium]|nr:MAG: hypothetical protein EOP50_07905 [Sphingobacteriales bacterium]